MIKLTWDQGFKKSYKRKFKNNKKMKKEDILPCFILFHKKRIKMLKTAKAIYKKDRLFLKDKQTKPEDGSEVIVIFESREKTGKKGKSFLVYGMWKDKFPKDFDLDKELHEVRSGWKGRLRELND